MAPIVAFTLTVYRWFLRLYPEDYRNDTGQLQLQTFRDQCLDRHNQAGALGIFQLWLAVPCDVVPNAIKLRVEMKPRRDETAWIPSRRYMAYELISMVGLLIVLFPSVETFVTSISSPLYTMMLFGLLIANMNVTTHALRRAWSALRLETDK